MFRVLKDAIRGLRANRTEKAMTRTGKALGTLYTLLDNFDHDNKVNRPSGSHVTPGFEKDRDLIVKHLQLCDIFTCHSKRSHASFPKPRDVLHSLEHSNIIDWIVNHI